MTRFAALQRRPVLALCLALLFSAVAPAQQKPQAAKPAATAQKPVENPPTAPRSDALHDLDAALQRLTEKVSPAVVEVLVSSYGPVAPRSLNESAVLGKLRSLGSGVILDPTGYIITNAHVVAGAQRVQVVIPPADTVLTYAFRHAGPAPTFEAKIIGSDADYDLALLKIDAKNLPYLRLADIRQVRQGQVAVAIGSPEGLENSVTMGVVSSVARQPDPDRPMIYIQTDAPINPGNSGGALVDVEGHLLGLNTFILSQGGGSEGLGFAIPSPVIKFAYDSFRSKGHIDRPEIGVFAQTITPTMAQALALPRAWGVVVSDLDPSGMAAASGMQIGDVLYSVDGTPINSMPMLGAAIMTHSEERAALIEVLRGDKKLDLTVPIVQHKHELDKLAESQTQTAIIDRISAVVITVDDKVAGTLPNLRIFSGAAIVARTSTGGGIDADLHSGDIIHAVNRTTVKNIEELANALAQLKSGDPLVFQIERQGGLQFLAGEVD